MRALVRVVARPGQRVDVPLECRLLHPTGAGPDERRAPVVVVDVGVVHVEVVFDQGDELVCYDDVSFGSLFVFQGRVALWPVSDG